MPTSYTGKATEQSDGRSALFFHNQVRSEIQARFTFIWDISCYSTRWMNPITTQHKRQRLLSQRLAQNAGLRTSVDVVGGDSDRFIQSSHPPQVHGLLHLERNRSWKKRPASKSANPRQPPRYRGAAPLGASAIWRPRTGRHPFSRRRLCSHAKGEDVWQSSLRVPAKRVAGSANGRWRLLGGLAAGIHEGLATSSAS